MKFVLISYSSDDQDCADRIRKILEKNRIPTWMAPYDIPAGSKYAEIINKAIKDCACVLLMLSNASQNSIWVSKEVERAINYRKTIIPVQIEELILNDEFELYLSSYQIIKIPSAHEENESLQKVLTVLTTYTSGGIPSTNSELAAQVISSATVISIGYFYNFLKNIIDFVLLESTQKPIDVSLLSENHDKSICFNRKKIIIHIPDYLENNLSDYKKTLECKYDLSFGFVGRFRVMVDVQCLDNNELVMHDFPTTILTGWYAIDYMLDKSDDKELIKEIKLRFLDNVYETMKNLLDRENISDDLVEIVRLDAQK